MIAFNYLNYTSFIIRKSRTRVNRSLKSVIKKPASIGTQALLVYAEI